MDEPNVDAFFSRLLLCYPTLIAREKMPIFKLLVYHGACVEEELQGR